MSSPRSDSMTERKVVTSSQLGGIILHLPCFFRIIASHRGMPTCIWGRKGPYWRKERAAKLVCESKRFPWKTHRYRRFEILGRRLSVEDTLKAYRSAKQMDLQRIRRSRQCINSNIRDPIMTFASLLKEQQYREWENTYLRERKVWNDNNLLVFSDEVNLLSGSRECVISICVARLNQRRSFGSQCIRTCLVSEVLELGTHPEQLRKFGSLWSRLLPSLVFSLLRFEGQVLVLSAAMRRRNLFWKVRNLFWEVSCA